MSGKGRKTKGAIELAWQGELNLQRIVGLRDELKQALDTAKLINIRFAAVDEVDIALLQLLCSAHRTAERAGSELRIVGEVPECFTRTLQLAGFNRHIGCAFGDPARCLWKAEFERTTGDT